MATEEKNDNRNVVFTLCFSKDLTDNGCNNRRRQALGLAFWMKAFWIPTQQRKYPEYHFQIQNDILTISVHNNNNKTNSPDWSKLTATALKKLVVEDLGDLAANELWNVIPETDADGRGRADLLEVEKQLSVKVVFLLENDDNHILLVGTKAKLDKKCLVIRNLLSHYYWRLTGKQVHL